MKCLFFITLLVSISTKAVQMQVSPNEKFTHAGQHSLASVSFNTNKTIIHFDIIYGRAYSTIPAISLLSIDKISYNVVKGIIDFNVVIESVHSTMMKVKIQSGNMKRIMILAVRYFIAFQKHGEGSFIEVHKGTASPNKNISTTSSATVSVVSKLKTTNPANIGMFDFLTGLNATSILNTFDVRLKLALDQTNTKRIDIKVTSDLPLPTYVRTTSYAVFVYDKQNANHRKFGYVHVANGSIFGQQSNVSMSNSMAQNMRDYNTMVGVHHFTLTNQTTFNMNIDIFEQNVFVNLSHGCFTIMSMLTYYCHENNRYHHDRDDLCYDQCPLFYYENQEELTCNLNPYSIMLSGSGGIVFLFVIIALSNFTYISKFRKKKQANDDQKQQDNIFCKNKNRVCPDDSISPISREMLKREENGSVVSNEGIDDQCVRTTIDPKLLERFCNSSSNSSDGS